MAKAGFRDPVGGTAYANVLGETFYPGIPDGSPVNINVIQKAAQDRFRASGSTVFMPLMAPNIDDMIQKAIFGEPNLTKEECENIYKANVDTLNKTSMEYLDSLMTKAETTTSNSANIATLPTMGSLMHAIADDKMTMLYKKAYPFQALIPVEANKGMTALWDAVGPYDFTDASFGSEDPSLTETDMTTKQRVASIKYMYTVGRLTKAAKMAGLAQVPVRDVKAIRVDMAQDAMRALRERSMLGINRTVNDTTFAFQSAGALEYAGVYELITNASSSATKTYIAGSGGITTYDDIMQQLDYSFRLMVKYNMSPNLAMCDYNTFGVIRRGMAEYMRYTGEPVKTLIPGLAKIDLVFPGEAGLPLVAHPMLNMEAGNYGSIFLMDTRLMARRVLWQDTYEELANINTSDKFVISAAETLIDKSDIDGTSSLQGGVFGITNTNPSAS